MKRPTKRRVVQAVKRDYMRGRNSYIEAVELDDGVMVVEYLHRKKVTIRLGHKFTVHCEKRLMVVMPDGRPRTTTVISSWFEDPKGNRKKGTLDT